MGVPAPRSEMIRELRQMLTPIVRTGAQVKRRGEVFRQIIALLETLPQEAA